MTMRDLAKSRDARIYLIGQSFSLFGDTAMFLALGIWVKELTHSNADAGLTFLFFPLASLFAPLAGMVVDRVRRRPTLIWRQPRERCARDVIALGAQRVGRLDHLRDDVPLRLRRELHRVRSVRILDDVAAGGATRRRQRFLAYRPRRTSARRATRRRRSLRHRRRALDRRPGFGHVRHRRVHGARPPRARREADPFAAALSRPRYWPGSTTWRARRSSGAWRSRWRSRSASSGSSKRRSSRSRATNYTTVRVSSGF